MNQQIIVPVVPVRRSSADQSEMVTQFLFGERVEVLEHKNQWRKCRSLSDQYEGWCDEKMLGAAKAADATMLLTHPITAVPMAHQSIYLPAGSVIERQDISGQPTFEGLVDAAMQFLGAPYLWGGKTILGIDCSGLVQVAAQLCGLKMPRDAWQQAEVGETVSFATTAQAGDLAYFDNEEGKIIHVGIIMQEPDRDTLSIIHAAGEVRIDRFDHQGIFREDRQKYSHKLRVIKRLVNH